MGYADETMAKTPKEKKDAVRPKRAFPRPDGKRRRDPAAPENPEPPEALPPAGETPLSDDEQSFINEYLIDRRIACAYRRAFPGCAWATADRRGREIYARPHVRAEIAAARLACARRCQVEADAVLKEIARIAMSDIYELFDPDTNLLRTPRHIPYETRKAVASITVSRERRTTTTSGRTRTTVSEQVVRYTLWNKNDALQKLAHYLGLNTAIPPLESLLAALPPDLRAAVAAAMRQQSAPQAVPPLPPPKPN